MWASQGILVVKNLLASAGDARDTGSIPGLERSSGGGYSHSLQDSCLGKSMDRGAWWAKVNGVTKSDGGLGGYSPIGFFVHRVFWARILEWVAISYSRGSFQPRD